MELPSYFQQQNRYDCAPTALSMLLGWPRHVMVQAFAHHGWKNDHRGCSVALERKVVREFGFDLVFTGRRFISIMGRDLPDGVAACHSLNVPGMGHALTWRDHTLLDPNLGKPGRNFYMPDQDPMTAISQFHVLAKKPLNEQEAKAARRAFVWADSYEEAQEAIEKWAA